MPMGGYLKNTSIQNFYNNPSSGINDEYNENNQPESSFGTTYPYTTYYQCQWLGPQGQNSGLPNNEPLYTTIPCSYRSNYQETSRYICPQDPNSNGIDSCTDVSIMS
jgi:hypothetical protein